MGRRWTSRAKTELKSEEEKPAPDLEAASSSSQIDSYAAMDPEEAARYEHVPDRWLRDFKNAGDGTAKPDMFMIRRLRRLIWLQTERRIFEGKNECWLQTKCVDSGRIGSQRDDMDQVAAPELQVEVIECDILEHAALLQRAGYTVAVLNMASPHSPGGGVRSGAGAQEENLFRRSDLATFLHPREHYPIKDTSCLVSPGVRILRGKEQDGYPFLAEACPVTVLSCAALQHPTLRKDRRYFSEDKERMQRKICALIDGAICAGCDACVFSAFGCGAFGNPPEEVARLFKKELLRGGLKKVSFCIFNDHNSGRRHNPRGNFIPFQETFRDLSGRTPLRL